MAKHGYIKQQEPEQHDATVMPQLAKALEGLGVGKETVADGGKNVLVRHEHTENRTMDDFEFLVSERPFGMHGSTDKSQATNANIARVCNPAEGVLIAHNNHTAPQMGLFQETPVTEYSPPHHWPDIAYLQWLVGSPALAEPGLPVPIKYIFRFTIVNEPANLMLNKIITRHGLLQYPVWPDITFDIASEEGRTILGTPNRAGTAWLLIQHKKQLGGRRIKKVTVFYAENASNLFRWPSLLLRLV